MIHFEQTSIQFHGKSILSQLDLHIPAQQAFGVIGPSGSGKSVFLKLIAGILVPTGGNILLNSEKVSMLFQKNALFDSLTLEENLLLPLIETLGLSEVSAKSRAMEFLEAVELDHSADLYPGEISGGMQKRLGIARALCIEPEVILYDEPTAGLDPITSRSIADLMIRLHHKNKTTLVMVSNDLQRIYQVCDQVGFAGAETIKRVGSPKELKKTQDPEIRKFIFSNAFTPKGASV